MSHRAELRSTCSAIEFEPRPHYAWINPHRNATNVSSD
jgi:hypothetical protein